MLANLSIHQFALVEHMELEFGAGMSVITGETGAGKSILLDALGLALGQRAEAGCVRKGASKAEVCATFKTNSNAQAWLKSYDFPSDDEVILRRIISAEGRSRGYINGRPVPANDLKEIASHLIDVHSQHAHQRLLEKDTPRQLLDSYAGLSEQTTKVSGLYRQWQTQYRQLKSLQEESAELQAQRQLLTYQVEELRELAIGEPELDELEAEHKRLANAENTLLSGQSAVIACLGDDNSEQAATQMVYQAIHQLQQIDDRHPHLEEARDLLQQAHIQLEEAGNSLQRYLDGVDINPHRLQQIESRLSDIYTMARKHHINAQQVYAHWQEQEQALAALSLSDEDLAELRAEVESLYQAFLSEAQALSNARIHAATQMDKDIEAHFEALSLGRARFITQVIPQDIKQAQSHGIDDIHFIVQTNPGMPAGPLAKVASGGELSRISLAIQVVTAATSKVPSLIFDEVDVGIGGGTAERVGRLMRKLGNNSQVMCVTHQPQVAAQAHQHFQVSKVSGDEATHTRIRELSSKQRAEELARMLGGIEITSQTLAHASEMLALVRS
ncbi:MAG: DNA repair protein RecN [Thalassolituus oleivorans]|uniref:DNA repair protein RecN n=1 Tax=Thalassolituus oleivorans TaxID=187493 RepID=UPI001B6D5C53|nr:DNA repair protein RecN [Thalassolituus oleivorans]MBQ0726726.1 DNA repair protein RecN [Thalassolituus oleivorans]MBQ0781695.1 DNA repair protein RecN [Thalassolituus oleivorans]